jgi:hypothetical protein
MCLSFFFDKARRFVIHFYEGFSLLRINLPTQSFPTSVCRFQQAFVVSDKALVVSDKALSFSDERFVGKSRATKLYYSHDGIPHSCPGVNAAK